MGCLTGNDRSGRLARFAAVAVGCLALGNCANSNFANRGDSKYGVSASTRVVDPGEPVPKGGGTYRVGKPYTIAGRVYVPEENINYSAEGIASWYGDDFHGRLTANGEVYDMNSLSAAHPTLPIPSYVRVTNLKNRRSIVVRVNDRGPYADNRIIDLSVHTAKLLGFHGNGLARVRVEYVGRAPLEGSDDRKLMATLREGDNAPGRTPPVVVASAKPFVAEFFDARPIERRPAMEPVATRSQSVQRAALEPPPTVRPLSTPAAPPLTSPVSAYAPVRYDAPAGFMSGRGLY